MKLQDLVRFEEFVNVHYANMFYCTKINCDIIILVMLKKI